MANKLKSLYLCKSLEELKNQALSKLNLERKSAKSLLNTAERLFLAAIKAEDTGDEELAFIYYQRHATILRHAMARDELCGENPFYHQQLGLSIDTSGVFESSLKKRYEQLQLESEFQGKEEPILKEEETEDGDENNCPICVSIPLGKIFQCREGHVVCEPCLRKIQEGAQMANSLPKCPYCSGHLDNDTVSRCRILETRLDRLTIDCCHKTNGCPVKAKRDAITLHEASCVYGQSLGICGMFGNASCNFKLSAVTANTVYQHIKTSHPFMEFQKYRFSDTWSLKGAWDAVSQSTSRHANASVKFTSILEVPHSQEYVLVIAKLTKHGISFHSVDLSLGLSAAKKPRVTFSVAEGTENFTSWTIPVACGIKSWKFLSDEEGCQKPLEIGIQSLIQHCDDNGKLKIDVAVNVEQ